MFLLNTINATHLHEGEVARLMNTGHEILSRTVVTSYFTGLRRVTVQRKNNKTQTHAVKEIFNILALIFCRYNVIKLVSMAI